MFRYGGLERLQRPDGDVAGRIMAREANHIQSYERCGREGCKPRRFSSFRSLRSWSIPSTTARPRGLSFQPRRHPIRCVTPTLCSPPPTLKHACVPARSAMSPSDRRLLHFAGAVDRYEFSRKSGYVPDNLREVQAAAFLGASVSGKFLFRRPQSR